MNTPIISIKDIGKQYTIGTPQPYYSLRDSLVSFLRHPFRLKKASTFWALQNVTFAVTEGEVLGIIGANGAGKSTLLKLLSRITPPSKGEILMKGRVASLLEVGTGFHPELSGKENIFLYGAILGMTRKEIKAKYEAIIKFADIGTFLDTPVKYYSSGMYVRLAFSVAVHLVFDVLIVDEVLAVGDMQFQKKCTAYMEKISKEGKTVLLVSHNMAVIEQLCTRVILLEKGKMIQDGTPKHVMQHYLKRVKNLLDTPLDRRTDRRGKGWIRFKHIRLLGTRGERSYAIGDTLRVQATVANTYPTDCEVRLSLSISTNNQVGLISCDSLQQNMLYTLPAKRESLVTCTIIPPALNIGSYHINMSVFYREEPEDWISPAAQFSIDSGTFGTLTPQRNPYPILVQYEWKVQSKVL